MRIAIVENTRITHHGQVGVALHERAARIDLYKPWADGRLPQAGDHDGLVVFGGEQAATDDHTHPYLPALCNLMRATTAENRAVLGICLGAQLLARAYGGLNRLGAVPEFGWREVSLTDAGRADPLLGHLPGAFPIFQWHSDTFTLPEGAVHLAASGCAPSQAFRIGRAAYATQFHFEASRAVVADWTRTFPDLTEAMEPGWAASHTARAPGLGARADGHGLDIARAWVGLV
jgi:GMP synthase (glutamine-hydrolysing)